MSARIPDTHAEAWALLPWLANGRIQASDREWVEAHVAGLRGMPRRARRAAHDGDCR